MARPTIRILLPPRSNTECYLDTTPSSGSAHFYHHPPSRTNSSASDVASVRSDSRSPTIIIRTRPSRRDDKHRQDSCPSIPQSSVQRPDLTTPSSYYGPRPNWYPQEHERQRPSSALSARRSTYSPEQHQYPPACLRQHAPPARSSVSSASSASSAHSRRSSSSSDYLYGEDFAYGTGPLQLQGRSSPSKAAAALVSTPKQMAQQRRRRVRFVMH